MKYNNIENDKKFTNVRLYGEKPKTVMAPSRNGTKNEIKNLLLKRVNKFKFPLL
ncbi:MAG: hypothetical protein FD546_000077 [Pelagibacterales bacterium]|nr:hypothetical protein [Pelagibacterales bacterium]